jgi:uncharacterized membrane protein
MADSFHTYLKRQLLEYVEAERKKGIPLIEIEKVLLNAGHDKNVIDEVFYELKQEQTGHKPIQHKNPVEQDIVSQLKGAFKQFMAQASTKEVKEAKEDLKNTDTDKVVEEVIEEAEVIEEKTMFEGIAFFGYLLTIALFILFSAGATDSQIVNVVIGFLPAIISVFISFVALPLADNVPLYVFIPLVVSSIFYAVGKFTELFQSLDVEGLAIVNFIIAFIFNILVVYIRFIKPRSMKRRVIPMHKSKPTPRHPAQKQEIKELKREFGI